ncbi:MAG: urea amidolyase associated protein UAAP1 [Pseudomonadales bacterium]
MKTVEYQDTLPGGRHWSMLVRRGLQLTLEDVDGGGNLAMLLYNPANPLEKLNLPDTLKAQHTFKVTQGHCLYSDMGRIFCSVVHDDVGWHDPASGTCNPVIVSRKWGESSYQTHQNEMQRNGRDCFLIELAKYGLGQRDLAANMNFFSKVAVDNDGSLALASDHSTAGATVTLRFEMDTLVVLHSCPHPLDASPSYPRRAIQYQLAVADPVASDDGCIYSRPENERGYRNTMLYQLGMAS